MLYYEEPYLKEYVAKILDRDGEKYLLDDTILYPGGGGQPPDRGFAVCNGKKYEIVHLGNGWHRINGDCEGEVKIVLDWEYRYLMMKSHTAEHAFFRFLQDRGAELGKINLGDVSTIFFTGEITIDDVFVAERNTRELIRSGAEVKTFWIDRDEVRKYEKLRINLNRIKAQRIRIVEIDNHDLSACTGVHVKNLSEIGDFSVVKFRQSKIKEVKFVVDDKAREYLYHSSKISRKIAWENNLDMENLDDFVKNLKGENENYTAILRNLSKRLEFNVRRCGNLKIFWQILYDDRIASRRIMDTVNREGGIVVVMNPLKNSVSCGFSPEYRFVRSVFLEMLRKHGGKGGGKGNFVSGSVKSEDFMESFMEEICEKLPN